MCHNDLRISLGAKTLPLKFSVSQREEETLGGVQRNQFLRMIITTLGTNIRREFLPGVSVKSTPCFVLKIKFCRADSPKTFLG